MKCCWQKTLALATGTGLLVAVLFPVGALAQEGDIEATISPSRSSAATRELQTQANAEPPKTDDRHELSVFHHKRGMANFRLGKLQ